MRDYCEAEHENTNVGCYGAKGHGGKHWSYSTQVKDTTGETQNHNGNFIWEWDNDAPEVPTYTAPEGSVTTVLSEAEIGILLMTLQPVSQFFPDLQDKLSAARAGLQK